MGDEGKQIAGVLSFIGVKVNTVIKFATGRWFSPGTPVSSTNKTDLHDITEILSKVALNTTNLSLLHVYYKNIGHCHFELHRKKIK